MNIYLFINNKSYFTTTDINTIKMYNSYLLTHVFLSSSSFVSPVFLSSEWYLQRRPLWTSSLVWQRWPVLSSANPWPCYRTAWPVSPDSPCVHASPWKSNTLILDHNNHWNIFGSVVLIYIFRPNYIYEDVQTDIHTLILWRLWQTICVYDTAASQKQLEARSLKIKQKSFTINKLLFSSEFCCKCRSFPIL